MRYNYTIAIALTSTIEAVEYSWQVVEGREGDPCTYVKLTMKPLIPQGLR